MLDLTNFKDGDIIELLSFGEKVTDISYLKVVIDDEEVIYSDGKITHSFQEEANGSMKDLIDFMLPKKLKHVINWAYPYNDYRDYILLYNNMIYTDFDEVRATFNISH